MEHAQHQHHGADASSNFEQVLRMFYMGDGIALLPSKASTIIRKVDSGWYSETIFFQGQIVG